MEINNRKLGHLKHALEELESNNNKSCFDEIKLAHRALPELDLNEVDSSINFLGKKLNFPLLISSMTGGDNEELVKINQNLAQAANKAGVAMAVGSQRIALEDKNAIKSFALRDYAPDILLFANLGAVQLNYGYGLAQAQQIVSMLQADALILHLNPLQEAIQTGGNLNFKDLASKIEDLAAKLDVPIILKEVGSGLSLADVKLGLDSGVKIFDIAGLGGTSFSKIEALRTTGVKRDLGLLFESWGSTTTQSLINLAPLKDYAIFIASGGVRSGLDMFKACVLGASLVGIAAPFLKLAIQSSTEVFAFIQQLEQEFKLAQFLVGAKNLRLAISNSDLLL